MFSKTSLSSRNDGLARSQTPPGSPVSTVSSVSNASPSTPNPSSTANTTKNATPPTSASQPSAPAGAPAPTPADAPREMAANDTVTGARLIVGPDVKLKGAEILDCDTLVVEGRVEATMDSRVIRIAEKGSFAGKVSIDIAEIRGHFEGELTARAQLIIHATGRVSGKIRYGKLVIDEGGEISGEIRSLSKEEQAGKTALEPIPILSTVAG